MAPRVRARPGTSPLVTCQPPASHRAYARASCAHASARARRVTSLNHLREPLQSRMVIPRPCHWKTTGKSDMENGTGSRTFTPEGPKGRRDPNRFLSDSSFESADQALGSEATWARSSSVRNQPRNSDS